MARIVKEHAVRRSELLEAARRLVFTQGYERMSIQDILDELEIAKGTFYHYFDSKQALLEAMIQSLLDEAVELMYPIVDDPAVSAVEKLQRVFDTIGDWKTADKEYHLSLLRVWYSEENTVARWKVRTMRGVRMRPLFAAVIHQGVEQGEMSIHDPEHASDVVLSLLQELIDALAAGFMAVDSGGGDLPGIAATLTAYTDGLERVLGIRSGSLSLVTTETLQEWLNAAARMKDTPDDRSTRRKDTT